MRILLVGAAGQVGTELRRSLAFADQLVATTRDGAGEPGTQDVALDVTDLGRIGVLIRDLRPDVVVNACAYTAVDRAEVERESAFAVNAHAPRAMAEACADIDAKLVHYSTDYVFDGSAARPYREDDPTAPLGVYGQSKLEGELAIRSSGVRHLILRTAWVYGLHGHNFLRTMLRVGAERDELRVVADQHGSPTPAWLIADGTASCLRLGGVEGTRHLVAGGVTSWHGFAQALFDDAVAAGLLARAPTVVPITTAEYPTPACRPLYSVLDTSRLEAELERPLPSWREALTLTFRDR
jgi:dTDP-4-dehydrorhamnose reductase